MKNPVKTKINLAVFISGTGTNLQAIIDASFNGQLDANIKLVLSNNPDAFGLKRAENADIPIEVLSRENYTDRNKFVEAMFSILKKYDIEMIALAGYLRKVPPEVIAKYSGRIFNIHPGPLPRFGGKGMFGLKVHEAVLEAGVKETCVTIHKVTDGYDEGEIVATRAVPIYPDDTPQSLQERVLKIEHEFYPEVLQKIARSLLDSCD